MLAEDPDHPPWIDAAPEGATVSAGRHLSVP
jgi:hypothetical protein